ncbi:maleylpyruvate isomerase family mycothiol-dependent enzyme [Fodinibacter luteus]|uniref:Maleylpyruvate isomerase family mycothiol-dependent enzyme n=1 Tax=Fodinibacter luteus TaxID=552064 RepID=A0ABP8KN19_9MICO
MPVHPPAPSDLGELVDAYARTVQNVIDLGRTMRPDDATRPTDCPGWTVLDQVAHVASTEAMVAGEPVPDLDVSGHAHVRHEFGARMEKYVESRRGRSLEEVLDELEERLDERLRVYRSGTEWASTPVDGPFGRTTLGDLLGVRVFDIWMHEQDIREALDRPGDLDSSAAAHTVSRLFAALPRIIARDAAIEPGNAVVLDLTGPTTGRAGARVEEQDGRAVGIPLFTGGADEHPDVVTTSLTMSTRVATRLAGGRRAPEDLHVVVHGDEDVARRVLAALVITP